MTQKIAILGAGAIGCWAGGLWADAAEITLIGRPGLVEDLRETGLTLDGIHKVHLPVKTDPKALAEADAIVLAMKAHALDAAMDQIERHARSDAVLISLLNGVDPVRILRDRFPARTIIAGMVPFNVVWTGPATLKRSGPGDIAVERHDITSDLPGVQLYDDLQPMQYGKLLLNLVNAINALSGAPLLATLQKRGYRRVYAASLAEALSVYDAADIAWIQVGPTSPRLATKMLKAPNWLFDRMVLQRQALDPSSMTSMAMDLKNARPTEIDTINGEIVRLGAKAGVPTPVNAKIQALVRQIETDPSYPRFGPNALCDAVLP